MYRMNEQEMAVLIGKAMEARKQAYAPYSGYMVGAALLCGNHVIVGGCNIENAAYTPSNCAERTAFFKAVSEGIREFHAIAIVGGHQDQSELDMSYPCGVCRQVMEEFCNPEEFLVIVARSKEEYQVYKLKELLPYGFGPANLKGEQ